MSEKNSIFEKKRHSRMIDFGKFNSLYSYIDEAVWRYNTRGIKGGERFSHMFRSSIGAVDYGMVKQVA